MNMKTAVGIAFAAAFATVVPLSAQEVKQTLSLDEAIEELGGDYTEEEIRLVRIKFMCEQGN